MITLKLNKAREFKTGEVVHLRVEGFYPTSPGKWWLQVTDITPLPGALPPSYECRGCGTCEPMAKDGGLPEKWVEKKFPERDYFLCPQCQKDCQFCRVCGCSQNDACEGGCSWVEEDLCSACAGKREV